MEGSTEDLARPGERVISRDRATGKTERGTVRCVCHLEQGLFYGVEWDDPRRGKHDGTLGGVRYFSCSEPAAGSFVKPGKVERGVSVTRALREKYCDDGHEESLVLGGARVELVGTQLAAAQKSLATLEHAGLRGSMAASAGPGGELAACAPNLRSVDLSHTLVGDFVAVAHMAGELPRLVEVDLSENYLEPMRTPLPAALQGLGHITTLRLDRMVRFDWPSVVALQAAMPNLAELHLVQCGISSLAPPEGEAGADGTLAGFPRLRLLNLDRNALRWGEINRLRALPCLEHLIVGGNPFTSIAYDGGFEALQRLSLLDSRVDNWASVNELNKFPVLREVKLSGSPVLDGLGSALVARHLLIARLPRVAVLNMSQISKKEREEAERLYIRHYGPDYDKAKESPAGSSAATEFRAAHPLYEGLVKVYGEYEKPKSGQHLLKASLLRLTFVWVDRPERKPLTKKLPDTMTVGKVKGMLATLGRVRAAELQLAAKDPADGRVVPLDDDLRELRFFSVAADSTLEIRCS